jgi:hypothetical protein
MWARGDEAGPVRSEIAWLEGGAYLVQRSDVGPETAVPADWEEHLPFPTVTMTGYDDTTEEFTTLYADGRGVGRVYRASFSDGVWKQWRSAPGFNQRFTATLSEDGNTLTGGWEMSTDGVSWALDFDVRYVRVR